MSEPDRETRTGRVRVGSLSLRYSISGSPRGDGHSRPLLLVNGIGANVEMWTPFRRALGDRCTIAFDAPGTGNSSTPLRPLTMRELGRVATGLLDELELRDVDVLGYSFGGAIAQEMARADDGRIAHLLLAATTCGWGTVPGDPLSLVAMLSPVRYYFGPATSAYTAVLGSGKPADFATADAARLHHPPDPLGYCWQVLAAVSWSSLPWLRELRVPTLVLAAERDRLVHRSTARLLVGRIRGARLEVVKGAGHFFLLRNGNRAVARTINAFLDGERDARRGTDAADAADSEDQVGVALA
jgi:pimeloyl-ACP methyl ester carboxylesterase